MKPSIGFTVLLSLAVLLMPGCSKSASSVGSRNTKAFQSANPETKASWDTALAAMNTNGFVTATVALMKLQQVPSLTPDQLKAVNETVTAVSDQMYAAANKGDANAKNAIEELRKLKMR